MAEVPPDWRAPVPQTPAMSSRRSGDALVACLLLLLQPPLIYITWFVVGFRAMGVGACAYGDHAPSRLTTASFHGCPSPRARCARPCVAS
jgi:hypothetical protein